MIKEKITIYYDKECPFCNSYVGYLKLKDSYELILKNVRARNHSEVFPIGTSLINNFTLVKSFYETLSGYIVEETTAGQDFSTKLTFSYI